MGNKVSKKKRVFAQSNVVTGSNKAAGGYATVPSQGQKVYGSETSRKKSTLEKIIESEKNDKRALIEKNLAHRNIYGVPYRQTQWTTEYFAGTPDEFSFVVGRAPKSFYTGKSRRKIIGAGNDGKGIYVVVATDDNRKDVYSQVMPKIERLGNEWAGIRDTRDAGVEKDENRDVVVVAPDKIWGYKMVGKKFEDESKDQTLEVDPFANAINPPFWRAIDKYNKAIASNTLDELDDQSFELIVEVAAKGGALPLVKNFTMGQSIISLKYIFKQATESLDFYWKSFLDEYSSNQSYVDALKDCLNRGVKVNVLLDRAPENVTEPLKLILDHVEKSRAGKVAIVSPKSMKKISELFVEAVKYPYAFVVSDKKRYWAEEDSHKGTSEACYNDAEMGRLLNRKLGEALLVAEPYLIK